MVESDRGPGQVYEMIQHTGPSEVQLIEGNTLNSTYIGELAAWLGVKETESEFDCALMKDVARFLALLGGFLGPESDGLAIADKDLVLAWEIVSTFT